MQASSLQLSAKQIYERRSASIKLYDGFYNYKNQYMGVQAKNKIGAGQLFRRVSLAAELMPTCAVRPIAVLAVNVNLLCKLYNYR
jgi:hypothetical protein